MHCVTVHASRLTKFLNHATNCQRTCQIMKTVWWQVPSHQARYRYSYRYKRWAPVTVDAANNQHQNSGLSTDINGSIRSSYNLHKKSVAHHIRFYDSVEWQPMTINDFTSSCEVHVNRLYYYISSCDSSSSSFSQSQQCRVQRQVSTPQGSQCNDITKIQDFFSTFQDP